MVGGEPLLHMTTDTRTQAQMQGAPGPTTIFHSDLPYIFVKKRFTLDSYVNWGSGNGGRTFALPQAVQDYRSNNPNQAHLLIIEESNGQQSIINPMLNMDAKFSDAESGFTVINCTSCINGADYQFAFTTSDSQLSAITRGNQFFQSSPSLTFRPWGTTDTRITIFRAPYGEQRDTGTFSLFTKIREDQIDYRYNNASDPLRFGRDLLSVGNDCVKVHIVFLNIENSPTTFNRLPDKTGTDINIEIDNFDVGGVDMLENTPIISRGIKNSGDVITSLIGRPVGSKITGFSEANTELGFVTTSNNVTENNTPVIEIPADFTPAQTMEIDFKDKTIKRDGNDIFTASTATSGLRVIGTKQFTFQPSTGSLTQENRTGYINQSVTISGSYTETPDANTIYLASTLYQGQQLLSSTIMTPGDNPVCNFAVYYDEDSANPDNFYSYLMVGMVTIANDGTLTPRTYYRTRNFSSSIVSVGFTLDAIDVRLIALSAN